MKDVGFYMSSFLSIKIEIESNNAMPPSAIEHNATRNRRNPFEIRDISIPFGNNSSSPLLPARRNQLNLDDNTGENWNLDDSLTASPIAIQDYALPLFNTDAESNIPWTWNETVNVELETARNSFLNASGSNIPDIRQNLSHGFDESLDDRETPLESQFDVPENFPLESQDYSLPRHNFDADSTIAMTRNEIRNVEIGTTIMPDIRENLSNGLNEGLAEGNRIPPFSLYFKIPENSDVYQVDENCSICCFNYNEQNKQPRILPCGHVICNECLYTLASENQYTEMICPNDRKVFKLRKE